MALVRRWTVWAVGLSLSALSACTSSEEPATSAVEPTVAPDRTASTVASTTASPSTDSTAVGTTTPASTSTTTPVRSSELVEGWNRLADGPLSARSYAMVVAVGDEVFVIGGSEHLCSPSDLECARPRPIFSDGAAWSVSTGRWRSIAPAPVSVWQGAVVALDGVIFVLVGVAPDRHLLHYDLAADVWSEVDGLPDDAGVGLAAVPSRGRLIVFGVGYEPEPTTDWLFDPEAETWTEIPDGASGTRSDGWQQWVFATAGGVFRRVQTSPDATATLERLVAGGGGGDGDGGPTWVHVAEIAAGSGIHAEGRWIIVPPFPPGDLLGARFDTVTGVWSDPLPSAAGWDVSTPVAGVVDDGAATYRVPGGKVLDLRTDAWIDVPPLDDRTFTSVTAIGTDLFVFGGQTWAGDVGTQLADAWLWVPPPL